MVTPSHARGAPPLFADVSWIALVLCGYVVAFIPKGFFVRVSGIPGSGHEGGPRDTHTKHRAYGDPETITRQRLSSSFVFLVVYPSVGLRLWQHGDSLLLV